MWCLGALPEQKLVVVHRGGWRTPVYLGVAILGHHLYLAQVGRGRWLGQAGQPWTQARHWPGLLQLLTWHLQVATLVVITGYRPQRCGCGVLLFLRVLGGQWLCPGS